MMKFLSMKTVIGFVIGVIAYILISYIIKNYM